MVLPGTGEAGSVPAMLERTRYAISGTEIGVECLHGNTRRAIEAGSGATTRYAQCRAEIAYAGTEIVYAGPEIAYAGTEIAYAATEIVYAATEIAYAATEIAYAATEITHAATRQRS
eukprot:2028938-Rhodomonas_salina.1